MVHALSAFERIWVGFSGGLDSTVLLHQLSQNAALKQRLMAIHVNHGLHLDANVWQKHCETFCHALNIPLCVKYAACPKGANQEALARAARYQQFDNCIQPDEVLVLAHHQHDQAETFLLNLCRGSGVDGLCAMQTVRSQKAYTIMRPLLPYSRQVLQQYAKDYDLSWVEDSSNQETQLSRNYLRHSVLPMLRARWPEIDKRLYQTTQHMQAAQLNLYDLACQDYNALMLPVLKLDKISQLPAHRLANVLWFWLKGHGVSLLNQAMIQTIIDTLIVNPNAKGKRLIFSEKQLWRHQDALYLEYGQRIKHEKVTWAHFPKPLSHTVGTLQAIENAGHLQFPMDANIELRFREGSVALRWHGQTKSLKKLFQALKIPVWQRDSIPLLYVNDALASIVGYAISDDFYTEKAGWKIEWMF